MPEDVAESPPPKAGKGIGSKLTKELGPLPVWGWGLVGLVGAYFVYKYISGKSAASAAATTAATSPATGTTGLGTAGGGGYSGGGDSQQLQGLSDQLTQLQQQLNPASSSVAGQESFQQIMGGAAAGSTASQLKAILASGQQVFSQIAPGVFVPYVPGSTDINAPLYIKDPTSGPAGGFGGGSYGAPISGAAAPSTTAAPSPITSGPLPAASPPGANPVPPSPGGGISPGRPGVNPSSTPIPGPPSRTSTIGPVPAVSG
jgi:hypothetical protein